MAHDWDRAQCGDCGENHPRDGLKDEVDWVAIKAMLKEPRHHFLLEELRQLARDKA